MSRISRVEVKCAMCGKKTSIAEIMSTNTMGSPDLDLRPPEMQRSTMPYWLQECPNCGFINSQIYAKINLSKEYLQTDQYINCDGLEFKNPLAKKFYKNALILRKIDDRYGEYISLLHTAWASDDVNDEDMATYCRLKMVELFEQLQENKKGDRTELARLADVMRRAGLFKDVTEKFENFQSPQEIEQKVVMFQVELAKTKDKKVYRVVDCIE